MSKQLQEKNSAEMMAVTEAFGKSQNFTSQDIVIPKVYAAQHMSEVVKNKVASYGEFVETLNNTVLGDLTKPFEVVPFYVQKKWYEFDIQTNKAGARKREYKQMLLIDHTNDNLPYTSEDGLIERDRVVDVYCVLPEEVKAGNDFPYVVSFRRTSLKAGNKVITQILRNEAVQKPPCAMIMEISGKDTSNDDGNFVVLDTKATRPASLEEMQAALKWYKMVMAGKTKVDDRDIVEEGKPKQAKTDDQRF